MFEVKDLKKNYKTDFWTKPVEVLKGISFKVGRGEIVGFLGANGAGKTTTIKMMMGFTSVEQGSISFFEQSKFKKEAHRIGYLPERPYFYPHLTGMEMVRYMGSLCNLSPDQISQGIDKYAKRLRIDHALSRKINGYSKGMLQRLGVLCTILHDPDLIILDEPLSGLDPRGRKDIKDLLVELNNEGKTIFFSSHIVSDVEEVCEKVVVLDFGEIVYQGDIDELIQSKTDAIYLAITNSKSNKLQDLARIISEKDAMVTYSIDSHKKNEFIKIAISEGIEIMALHKDTPTLEEIVYKTGGEI
ncbi:hypothetical protein A9Q84_21380 [Halobacteriovorax marinus]|uniref:ABC transporter domain-containing protein n=1 Tax=Halobacteriovorax marinus TaxID=97084 RepID=A0A1Y5F1M9_9BACT|nr:hypothetical protein A9Q84_21380 [Halobacteriovorax marinus]